MRAPVLRSACLAVVAVALALAASPAGARPGAPPSGQHRLAATGLARHGLSGRWTVSPAGAGSYRLTWHSSTAIPVTDAAVQARHDGAVVTASVAPDSRSVSVVVASPTPPDPSTYDVVLGTRVLDRRGGDTGSSTSRTPYRAPQVRQLLRDPGKPGTHAITSSDYQLSPRILPDLNQRSEMVGHIVAPVDATDASPLVLFLHGRHEACYSPSSTHTQPARGSFARQTRAWSCPPGELPVPSYLGYDYVQRRLAGQGYVTVSISADAINALDFRAPDAGAAARASLIRDHLNAWVGFVDSGTHPADLSKVVLVGHSRGGEGVNRASLDLPADKPYHVVGQVLIGPTDFAFQAAPSTPTVTLLPYCDGDVSDLQGQNFTDDGRDIPTDPTTGLAFHSSVLVMGANHNFFNSEWTPGPSAAPSFDDWGGPGDSPCSPTKATRLSPAQQRKVGTTYIAGAVHLFARGDDSVLPMFDGSAVAVPSAGNADVRSHAIGGGIVTARPGIEGTAGTGGSADVRLCEGVSDSGAASACRKKASSVRTPHWPSEFFTGVPHREFLDVGWTSSRQRGGLDLDAPWDLSADSRLDLRTIVDPGTGPVRLGVSLTDAAGHTEVVTPLGGGRLDPLPSGGFSLPKRWGQDLRVPLAGVTRVDLTRITQVGVVSKNGRGRIFVADVSATPAAGISAAPTTPTPVFHLGSVRQPEGDGTDIATVDVPWHVSGGLDHDAVLAVVRGNPFDFGGSGSVRQLVIPAHTHAGVIHIKYRPNDLDDQGVRFFPVTTYPVSGIETDQYIGGATVVDDDPTPRLALGTDARRVKAGERATWRLTLQKPVNYDTFAAVRAVKVVGGPQLRVGDLPQKFRDESLGEGVDLATPLYRTDLRLFARIPAHGLTGTVSLPTRPGSDVRRAVSMQFEVPGFTLPHATRTVLVTPSH